MPKKRSTKRGKGEGLIRQRPDGRWEARATIGVTDKGRSKSVSVYAKTRDEVAKKLTSILSKFNVGKYVDPSKNLVSEYLAEWLEHHHSLQQNTKNTYENYIRANINPYLGNTKLVALTPLSLEVWIRTLVKNGKGPTVVKHAYTIFKTALRRAVEWGILETNPLEKVKKPPPSKIKRKVWTPQEAQKFLEVASTHRFHALYLLFLLCGLRRGEVLGLRWSDIDFETKRIKIEQTLIFLNGVRTFKATPKSAASERGFKLPLEVWEALKVRHGAYILERDAAGKKWIENNLVFPYPDGSGFPEAQLRRIHTDLCARAGVPRITPHEMRHTYTSLALLRGVDTKEVSRRLGHARVQTTLDIYQHLYPEQDDSAALSSADLFNLKPPEKPPAQNPSTGQRVVSRIKKTRLRK